MLSRHIRWHREKLGRGLDPDRRVAALSDGSADLATDKRMFGGERIRCWFGRDWSPTQA
jgi:hypothetical protein